MLPGFERSQPPTGGGGGGNPRKTGNPKQTGNPKGKAAQAAGQQPQGPVASLDKQTRLQINPKAVYHYEDGTFSMGSLLVDWPGICKLNGWDVDAGCGPVQCTMATTKGRDFNCMNSSHK